MQANPTRRRANPAAFFLVSEEGSDMFAYVSDSESEDEAGKGTIL